MVHMISIYLIYLQKLMHLLFTREEPFICLHPS